MYVSTRSNYITSDMSAVLKGIAPDGGLFVDNRLFGNTDFDTRAVFNLSYEAQAEKIMGYLLPGFADSLNEIVKVYAKKFSSPLITPVVKVGDDYALELFHGPTSAFKDVALSVLPLFITKAKKDEGIKGNISILTATSGDTGKAALEGFHDVEGTDITVFFPENGVSAMQKAQMVTQEGSNVRVCGVLGNFDDCQRGVKEAFAQKTDKLLSSANSINIGRLVPQVVYYFNAYSQLIKSGDIIAKDSVDFVIPTGNFGDILAGYIAKCLGLKIGKLVCASNSNNILSDFISTGVYDTRREFLKTASPSMDILVSSNLERMLYYSSNGDSDKVAALMKALKSDGVYSIDGGMLKVFKDNYSCGWASEKETALTISRLWNDYHWLSDTHSAVAFSVLEKYKKSSEYTGNKCVVLSTASPFKFPGAVLEAIGTECGSDDFESADILSDSTGIKVPDNLKGLKYKERIHKDVIGTGDIVSYSLKE